MPWALDPCHGQGIRVPIHARAGPARSDGPRSLAGFGTRSDHRTARRATPELGTPLSASPCREHQQAAAPSWPGARRGESMPACALTRCRPGLTRPQRRGLPLATRAEGKRVSALSRPLDPPEPCCPPTAPTCSFTTSCACPRPMTARSSSPPRTWARLCGRPRTCSTRRGAASADRLAYAARSVRPR